MRVINEKLISNLSTDLLIKKKKKRSRKIKKNPNTGKYHCEACLYNSSRQFNVIRHQKRIHLPQIQRLCCDEIFKTKGEWYKHCESVHPEKRPSYISKKKYKLSTKSKSQIKFSVDKNDDDEDDDDDDDDYGDEKMDVAMKNELNFAVRSSKRIAAKHIRRSFIMKDEFDDDNDDDYDYDDDEDDHGYHSKDGDKENQDESYDDCKDMNNNLHETLVNNNINITNYNISTNNYIFTDMYNNYQQCKSYINEYFVNYYGVFDDDDDDDDEEENDDNNNNKNNNNTNDNDITNNITNDITNDDDENKENICPQTCFNQLPFKKRKYVRERNFGTPLSTITNTFNNKTDDNEPVKIKMQNRDELQNLTRFQLGYLTDFIPENFKIPTKY